MDKNGFSSFLLGLGVGIGIGMLFAPKAGADTRQLLKDKTGEGADYLKQRGSDLKDSAGDLLNKSKDALNRRRTPFPTPWKPASRPIAMRESAAHTHRGRAGSLILMPGRVLHA